MTQDTNYYIYIYIYIYHQLKRGADAAWLPLRAERAAASSPPRTAHERDPRAVPQLVGSLAASLAGIADRSRGQTLTNPIMSPLTVKYECPRLSLSIITSDLSLGISTGCGSTPRGSSLLPSLG